MQQLNIAEELKHSKVIIYRPQLGVGSNEVRFIWKTKREKGINSELGTAK